MHEIDGRDTNTVFGHPPYREVICPNVFLDERDPDPARRFKMVYLCHGRDGKNWNRLLDHRPFIPHGGPGSYDEFGVETTCPPIEVGDEVWFYYGGMKVHHDWWVIG